MRLLIYSKILSPKNSSLTFLCSISSLKSTESSRKQDSTCAHSTKLSPEQEPSAQQDTPQTSSCSWSSPRIETRTSGLQLVLLLSQDSDTEQNLKRLFCFENTPHFRFLHECVSPNTNICMSSFHSFYLNRPFL